MGKQREEHSIGNLSDFPEGSHRVVKVGRREIGIFNIGGELYGLPNLCPHQTGPLCEGKTATGTLVSRQENDWKFEWVHEGEIVTCPWHGLEYHVPTGGCLAFPEIQLRRYEVLVEGGEVKVRV
jgi:nitrite reductase/ring-hydroxylating ferredoxin subunit